MGVVYGPGPRGGPCLVSIRLWLWLTVEPLVTDTSLIQTPVYYIQFPMSWQNSHIIIFFKKNLYDTDSL